MAGKSMAELRGEFRPLAEKLVRVDLLIDEVAVRENITLSDDEFDAALETIASMYELPPAEVLGMIGAATLRAQLIRDKARAMIVDSADTF
jgi:FKBP-type peptidyl-prolyl cis-trans isomerase (trigger factor)